MLSISVHTDSRSTIEILKQDNANKKSRHIQIWLKSVQRLLGKVMHKVWKDYCWPIV